MSKHMSTHQPVANVRTNGADVQTHVYTHVCKRVYTHVYAHAYTPASKQAPLHTLGLYEHAYAHAYVPVHMHVIARLNMHARTSV